jgi:tetratricopeptide (TPR) repeat protein
MSDGGLAGLRRFLGELVQEGRTRMFIETARVMGKYEIESDVDAFLVVARSDSPQLKALAQVELGRIAAPVNADMAMEYLLQAYDSGQPEAMPRAVLHMAELLEDVDMNRAVGCYLRAVETGDPTVCTKAALRVGEIVGEERSDIAEWAYTEALEAPEPAGEATLAMRLGVLVECFDPDEALALYRRAQRTGDAETAARCALFAGLLLDDEQAEPELERALASTAASIAGLAAFHLGVIHERRGNLQEAECWFRRAIASDSEATPEAWLCLGDLLKARDAGAAQAAFAAAIDSGHPKVAPRAAYILMVLLKDQDRFDEGCAVYERVRPLAEARGGPLDAQRALLAALAGEQDEAARYLAAAIEAGEDEAAGLVLGEAIRRDERGQAELALAACLLAETAGGRTGLLATGMRAGVLRDLGRRAEAIALYRSVVDADHGEISDRSAFQLAEMLAEEDPASARALYERAAASPDSEVADAASLRLLML